MSPVEPTRLQIVQALVARLSAIRLDDSEGRFFTDVGWQVYLHELPELGEDDPREAVAVILPEDEVRFQGMNVASGLPIEIHAIAYAGPGRTDPGLAVERVLADIRRAVELSDRTLGGLLRDQLRRGPTRTVERQEGSLTIGAAATYVGLYVEGWGD